MHQLNLLAATPFAGQPRRNRNHKPEPRNRNHPKALAAEGGIHTLLTLLLNPRVRHGSDGGKTPVWLFLFLFALSVLSPSRYNYLPT